MEVMMIGRGREGGGGWLASSLSASEWRWGWWRWWVAGGGEGRGEPQQAAAIPPAQEGCTPPHAGRGDAEGRRGGTRQRDAAKGRCRGTPKR